MKAIQAYTKSSSFFVSFFFITLLMLGVGFNTYTLNIANDELLIRETEAAIQADIIGFKSLYEAAGRESVINEVLKRLNTPSNDSLYYLKDSKDIKLAGNLSSWPTDNFVLLKNGLLEIEYSLPSELESSNHTVEQQSAIAMVFEFGNKDTLLVARSLQNIELIVSVAKMSSSVMIAILCLIALTSLGVAYYVVNRINKIAQTADEIIATGNLSDRLHVDSQWDDLSKLTLVLNHLLDKIEQYIKAIRSVSDNIAHDLRTPLTRLRGHIDEIENQPDKKALLSECDNLLSIFQSLLRISDIENSARTSHFSNVNVNTILEDASDLYSPLAESKSIELKVACKAATAEVIGDKDMLFQAFANVIDNAIKFTPEKGLISISTENQLNTLVVKIEDSGIGVDQQSIDRLTQRFYRADKSRSTAGNGLGLSLVQAIIVLHGGTLNFSASTLGCKAGLLCELTLPFIDVA